MIKEKWKQVKGFNGYQISNYGKVFSTKTNKYLKLQMNKDGYMCVTLNKKKVFVHRLVAIHFIPNRNKKCNQVNHIDGDKANNYVGNLEWTDNAHNQIHAYKNGLKNSNGVKKANSKKIRCIETGEEFNSIMEASKTLGINRNNISNSCYGDTKNTKGLHFEFVEFA